MKNKHVVCIVGRTCTGKDTIQKYIKMCFGIKPICSYTTRPKRINEIDGVQHRFVSKDAMDKLMASDGVLAYREIKDTNAEYCATIDLLTDDIMTYIINPNALDRLRSIDGVVVHTIYLKADDDILRSRSIDRGDKDADFVKRLASETEEYNEYEQEESYSCMVDTTQHYATVLDWVSDYMVDLLKTIRG